MFYVVSVLISDRLGLDPKLLAKILNMSSGRCWSSDTYNPVPGVMEGVPSANNYQGGFGTTLMAKVRFVCFVFLLLFFFCLSLTVVHTLPATLTCSLQKTLILSVLKRTSCVNMQQKQKIFHFECLVCSID